MAAGAGGGAGSLGGGIGGAIGGIAALAMGGDTGTGEYKKAVKAWEQLRLSNFDYTSISGQDLALVAQYFPEQYNAVVPKDVQLAVDSQFGRAGEMGALAGMQDIAAGDPTADRISARIAGEEFGGQLSRSQNNITSDLAQRGRLGGGEEIAARIAGNQASTDYASKMANQLAQAAMARRMEALTGSSQIANRLRSGDINLSQSNADAVNNFNMQRAGIQNAASQWNAGQQNQAGMYNTQQKQNVANANVNRRNVEQQQNIQYPNELRDKEYSQALAKVQGTAGAYQALGGQKAKDLAMRNQLIVGTGQGLGQAAGGVFDYGGFGG